MSFEPRRRIPGLEPEAERAIVEVQTAIARECKRLEKSAERPRRRRTELVEEGSVIAKPGEVVRVQPGEEDVTVVLPEPSPASDGEDIVISFEGDGTAAGRVLVVPASGTCLLPGIQTLNAPGSYRFTSTGGGATTKPRSNVVPIDPSSPRGGTWSGPPPVTAEDLPEDGVDNSILDDMPGNSVKVNASSATANPTDLVVPTQSVIGRAGGDLTTLSAIGRRQFLATSGAGTVSFQTLSAIFPGGPIYDVMAYPFNATGDGVADDTAALNAAIAAANAAAGVIYLGRHHRITAALTPITASNVAIQGRGHFNGGTAISIDAPSAANFITIDEAQYVKIRDVWIRGVGALYTTGAAIYIYGSFRIHLDRLLITQMAVGVDIESSGPIEIHDITISDVYGAAGIRMRGSAAGVAHAMEIVRANVSTSMPSGVVGFTETWAPTTAYVVGNAVVANGNIYQAVTAGTSAGAGGPSGVPGTTVANANTARITDGTVEWVWAMSEYTSFLIEEYTSTVRILDSGGLQGAYGIRMIDGSGGVNPPAFLRCVNVEFDHVATAAISLEGGGQAEFEQTFVTSMLNGPAIQILDTFDGLWRFNGGVLFGSGVELMTIAAPYGIVSNMIMSGGGIFTLNTYDAVRVDSTAHHFQIVDCSISASPGDTVPNTRYGIFIAGSCDNYLIQGNNLLGHRTGDILNGPGTGPTRLVRNNIPDVFMYEVEEPDAGPFNDYDPLGARHIMASNAAGVFTGVVAGGVGDVLVFTHQGTGYTELQHNTGSANANRFINGRLGKNLRIYDNEAAVYRYIDQTAGATAGTRWTLISPQFPFAHASDSALGDVVAHDGSHYTVVSGGGNASVVLRGDATFGAAPASAITEVEETGAGPFNDYAPTGNARHIMASNAAGVFNGVSVTGYVLGDFLIFTHQGTGFTEFTHNNAGSTATNRFFTGRLGKDLRIFDNEPAVFRLLDTTSGGTTALRWVLISPQFPYAQGDDDATGDIVAFNGTNYARITGGNSADVVLRGNATFGTVSTAAIANNAVTDPKLRDSAALSVIGRQSNTSGDPADIVANAGTDADCPLRVNAAGTALTYAPLNTPGITDDAVTNPKLANMAQSTIKGRAAGAGTGDPTDLTASQVRTIVGSLLAVTSYDSGASGTHTFHADAKTVLVRAWGAGSGGYGCAAASASEIITCSGGGGGGYVEAIATSPAASCTYSVGSGGSGGSAASPSDPGEGGTTSATMSGASVQATGGSSPSGTAMASGLTIENSAQASAGGGGGVTGAPWTLLVLQSGESGETGLRLSGSVARSGKGGNSGSGSAGGASRISGGVGNPAGDTGGGGGGAASHGTTAQAGGAGRGGRLVIYEFT